MGRSPCSQTSSLTRRLYQPKNPTGSFQIRPHRPCALQRKARFTGGNGEPYDQSFQRPVFEEKEKDGGTGGLGFIEKLLVSFMISPPRFAFSSPTSFGHHSGLTLFHLYFVHMKTSWENGFFVNFFFCVFIIAIYQISTSICGLH